MTGCKLCRKPHPEDPMARVWPGKRLYPWVYMAPSFEDGVMEPHEKWEDEPCECSTKGPTDEKFRRPVRRGAKRDARAEAGPGQEPAVPVREPSLFGDHDDGEPLRP